MKTPIIFYHRSDLDGHCSGAIAALALEKYKPELIGVEYGDPFPWDKIPGRNIVMTDFSLQPWSDMQDLAKEARSLVWIDHHRTAIDNNRKSPLKADRLWTVLDEEHAACELAWMYYHPRELMPKAVFLLGRYDIWDHAADKRVLPFQMGMRLEDTDPKDHLKFWKNLFYGPKSRITDMADRGEVILKYQEQSNKELMKRAFDLEWKPEGLKFLAVNQGGINSMAFDSAYDPEKHDGVLSFFYTGVGDHWKVSLYSPDQSRDLSVYAKIKGGGGHPYACGFQVKDLSEIDIY